MKLKKLNEAGSIFKMKKSKRVKINFNSVNGKNYTIIPPNKINQSRDRIRKSLRQALKNLLKYRNK